MNETTLTVQGNVATDVALRTTRSGHEVASFRVACTPRRYDKQVEQWVDGQAAFYQVSCWRSLARNAAESLKKGLPVIVHGRLTQRMYERDVNGETVRSYASEIDALCLGPDLRYGVAEFRRAKSQAIRLAEDRARNEAMERAEPADADEGAA
ncbi:MAG: single-stranded DNA-binding protein [Candidatus Nanopelagicales bacterium]|nr:single-stranded DNA-binding protein [Candidatus Nanopelagicales bacterium]